MSFGDSSYTIGRGKPPLHTRFQKGQSGNPSGKPGPAKIARQRFQRALYAALEAETFELKDARPRGNLDGMARKLTLAAAGGERGAIKLILSELDKEIARGDADQADDVATESSDARDVENVEEESRARGAPACAAVAASARRTDEPPPMMDYALWVKAQRERSG